MKNGYGYKFSAIFLVLVLTVINLNNLNYMSPIVSADQSNEIRSNTFNYLNQGGDGEGDSEQENERYGWNITKIDSFNQDNYIDLVVSTPWHDRGTEYDTGAIYIFYGKANSEFDDLNPSAANVIITGEFDGDRFGWDVDDAGDVNGDGINDLVIGAPNADGGYGCAYIIYGGDLETGSHNVVTVADRVFNGKDLELNMNAQYGSSVEGVGDINKDSYDDVIVGAPGADKAVISYGFKNKASLFPNLWDDDLGSNGVVTFANGVNNGPSDANTWGLQGDDDGWDWIDSFSDPTNLYGQTASAPHDNANLYAPMEPGGPDADGLTWKNKTTLEVMIGRNHTHLNPYGDGWNNDPASSAAWGLEFSITPRLYDYISKNSTISISFDYMAMDSSLIYNNSNLSRRYTYTIRSRIWNSSTIEYLGDQIVNNEKYVLYKQDNWNVPPWGPIYGHFEAEISDYIDQIGSYYWDFGCYFSGGWSTRYDDGMMAFFDNITMKIVNERNSIIQGASNSNFGTALSGLGDINGDSYPDYLISAPNMAEGTVGVFHGKNRYDNLETANFAAFTLMGENLSDRFGYSISSAGDVDHDGLKDIIIGAPGGNYAHLYYGSTLKTSAPAPDLSEKNEDKNTQYIEFDSGFATTGNTPGINGPDDGWDIWNGVYGYQDGATPGSSVTYNGVDTPDSAAVAVDKELIIAIGGNFGGGSTGGAKPDSGAYGVKFYVTQDMIDSINTGGEAVLSYDWRFENHGLDMDDTIWIKTYLRSKTDDHALGLALDDYAADPDNKDDSKEVHWSNSPADVKSTFIQKCSEYITSPGWYYLDFGAKVRNYWWENNAWEDGLFCFDNLYLRINPPPDFKFIGPENSSFGYCVGCSNKLNLDKYCDIVISAPEHDSKNGMNSGAVFGFLMGLDDNKEILAEAAEFIAYGENPGDKFGWTLISDINLNSDEFSEIITSAINYGSSVNNAGKLYILTITKGPRIKLLKPDNKEILTGEVLVSASVTDPDMNIDTSLGVYFHYSTDKITWELIGNDLVPDTNSGLYEFIWNTSSLPDASHYYVKGWVQDLELNKGENISKPLTIDNLHPPEITIQSPKRGSTVSGLVEVSTLVQDSELDNIGGGINLTEGVQFYFSEDKLNWEALGVRFTGIENVYSVELSTDQHLDGEYWLKVNATDLDGFLVEEIINFTIDNPNRPPSITLLSPLNVTKLSGTVKVSASALDFDRDINSSGVTFYIATEAKPEHWWAIGNAPEPVVNATGTEIYSIDWDTTNVPDFWYQLKAVANDSKGSINESALTSFHVHNNKNNAPFIELVNPIGGKVLETTQVITARVRDLENNIDPNGVFYYYSVDKEVWHYLGNTANPRKNEFYDFYWLTDQVDDGKYWLNVSVADTDGHTSRAITDRQVIVHNSNLNPPEIKIVSPTVGQHINGDFKIQARAYDMEENIDKTGVTFYYSQDRNDWTIIKNVAAPTSTMDNNIYELTWDTGKFDDGKYWLRAEVRDIDGLTSQVISDYFYIHNSMNNSPVVELISDNTDEVKGIIKINASVFDLENNLQNNGVTFYYSTDKKTWTKIGNDPTGSYDGEKYIFEYTWDTSSVSDNKYWLRAVATDNTDLTAYDLSVGQVFIHNHNDNPPLIEFKAPDNSVPLGEREAIIVNVIDFENDIEGVSFYYSQDNSTWKLIGTVDKSEKGDVYRVIWSTAEVNNGVYYLKVKARDRLGHSNEIISGPYEVASGKEVVKDENESTPDYLPYAILIVIVIIIIIIVSLILIRRSKKHEEDLVREVENEIIQNATAGQTTPKPQITMQSSVPNTQEPIQTYIPPSEVAIQDQNIQTNVQFNEPEPEVETINNPEIPPDIELPPDIDLPSEDLESEEQPDIPVSPFVAGCKQPTLGNIKEAQSPFSEIKTQSLKDELGGNAEVIELPTEDE